MELGSVSNITRTFPPYMKFLFVGSNICRQLLSDLQLQTTHLLLTNDMYCNSFGTCTL